MALRKRGRFSVLWIQAPRGDQFRGWRASPPPPVPHSTLGVQRWSSQCSAVVTAVARHLPVTQEAWGLPHGGDARGLPQPDRPPPLLRGPLQSQLGRLLVANACFGSPWPPYL